MCVCVCACVCTHLSTLSTFAFLSSSVNPVVSQYVLLSERETIDMFTLSLVFTNTVNMGEVTQILDTQLHIHTYISEAPGSSFSEGWLTSEVNLETKKIQIMRFLLPSITTWTVNEKAFISVTLIQYFSVHTVRKGPQTNVLNYSVLYIITDIVFDIVIVVKFKQYIRTHMLMSSFKAAVGNFDINIKNFFMFCLEKMS